MFDLCLSFHLLLSSMYLFGLRRIHSRIVSLFISLSHSNFNFILCCLREINRLNTILFNGNRVLGKLDTNVTFNTDLYLAINQGTYNPAYSTQPVYVQQAQQQPVYIQPAQPPMAEAVYVDNKTTYGKYLAHHFYYFCKPLFIYFVRLFSCSNSCSLQSCPTTSSCCTCTSGSSTSTTSSNVSRGS